MSKLFEITDSHDDFIVKKLRESPNFAREYLKTSLEDGDSKSLLRALRQVAKARGGISKIAEAAGVHREAIDRALSGRTNPRLETFLLILNAMGIKLDYQV